MSKRTRCRAGHSNPTAEKNRRKERRMRMRSVRTLFCRPTQAEKKAMKGIYEELLRAGAVVEVKGDWFSLDAKL
jgi:hypothetical protein